MRASRLSLLVTNPVLFAELARAALAPAPPREGVRRRRVGGVEMEFDCSIGSLVGAMYAGAYEVAVVHRLRRLVRRGSAFLDVGANVGYLSAVAADAAGPEGEVHAFEPVPRYFRALERLADLNPSRRIHAHALAVGEAPGVAKIGVSRGPNTGWNTMVPGAADADSETVDVPVTTLDDHVRAHALAGRDLVVKVDAEGFEFPVLRGFARTLAEAQPAPRLVCEVSPDAYPRMGTSLAALAAFLAEVGYRAYGVETLRPVDVARLQRITDVVLLRGAP